MMNGAPDDDDDHLGNRKSTPRLKSGDGFKTTPGASKNEFGIEGERNNGGYANQHSNSPIEMPRDQDKNAHERGEEASVKSSTASASTSLTLSSNSSTTSNNIHSGFLPMATQFAPAPHRDLARPHPQVSSLDALLLSQQVPPSARQQISPSALQSIAAILDTKIPQSSVPSFSSILQLQQHQISRARQPVQVKQPLNSMQVPATLQQLQLAQALLAQDQNREETRVQPSLALDQYQLVQALLAQDQNKNETRVRPPHSLQVPSISQDQLQVPATLQALLAQAQNQNETRIRPPQSLQVPSLSHDQLQLAQALFSQTQNQNETRVQPSHSLQVPSRAHDQLQLAQALFSQTQNRNVCGNVLQQATQMQGPSLLQQAIRQQEQQQQLKQQQLKQQLAIDQILNQRSHLSSARSQPTQDPAIANFLKALLPQQNQATTNEDLLQYLASANQPRNPPCAQATTAAPDLLQQLRSQNNHSSDLLQRLTQENMVKDQLVALLQQSQRKIAGAALPLSSPQAQVQAQVPMPQIKMEMLLLSHSDPAPSGSNILNVNQGTTQGTRTASTSASAYPLLGEAQQHNTSNININVNANAPCAPNGVDLNALAEASSPDGQLVATTKAAGPPHAPNQSKVRRWMMRYKELNTFQKKHGHCRVPHDYTENRKLSWWVMNQRAQYQSLKKGNKSWLTEKRVELLEAIGFDWKPVVTHKSCKTVKK